MEDGAEAESERGREGDERYRYLVENAFDIIVECAANGRILYVGPNIQGVLGYAPDEIIGGFINELVHPDDVRKGVESFSSAVMRGDRIHATLRYRHKSGGWRAIEGRGRAFENATGKTRVVIIGRDISDGVAADLELRRLLRRIQLQVEQTPVAIVAWNLDGRITEWNPAAARLFGFSKSEMVGQPTSRLVPQGSARVDPFRDDARAALTSTNPPVRYSSENVTKNGRRVTCEWLVSALVDETHSVTGFLGIAEDVAGRAAIRRLEDLAYQDPITGIANRRAFDERLGAMLEARRRRNDALAVLYVDLDEFKSINDLHGHAIGDRVLAAIGLRLQVCVRENDMVARIGGDEFGVLLTQLASEGYAEEVAARIIDSLGRPLDAGEMSFLVRASVGIAQYPADGTDAASLVQKADAAMYRAKQKGRSTYSL
jgi:diguanylate cyclase (GGDEF)-like protein/PAS domain S-box-containing protein